MGHQHQQQDDALAHETLETRLALQSSIGALLALVEHTRAEQAGGVVDGHADDQRGQASVPAAEQPGNEGADQPRTRRPPAAMTATLSGRP